MWDVVTGPQETPNRSGKYSVTEVLRGRGDSKKGREKEEEREKERERDHVRALHQEIPKLGKEDI